MKYQYSVVAGQANTDGHYTRRPIVETTISINNHNGRKFLALIDSGADQIIMPAAIAEVLGIDRTRCQPWQTLGISMDTIDGFVAELTFQIQHQSETFRASAVFIDREVPVLLGREGFFDSYRIKFEQDHHTFEITPVGRK